MVFTALLCFNCWVVSSIFGDKQQSTKFVRLRDSAASGRPPKQAHAALSVGADPNEAARTLYGSAGEAIAAHQNGDWVTAKPEQRLLCLAVRRRPLPKQRRTQR